MSLSEKSSDRQFSLHFFVPSEDVLLALITVCFIVLHVLAFIVLTPARQNDAVAPTVPTPLSHGD